MSIKTNQERIWGKHAVVGITIHIAAAWLRLRRNGFPYYDLSELERAKELLALVKYGPASIVAGESGQSEIAQTMHAQGFFWSYHPHAWEVRCGKMLTPMEVFLDDEKLWETLGQRTNHGSVNSLTDSEVRKGLKAFAGAQGVSGFRPTAAWAVYDRFCPAHATVYDPSMGWGGRLVGAFMCPKVDRYIGCEPSTKTFAGLMQMEADLRWTVPSRGLRIEMHREFSARVRDGTAMVTDSSSPSGSPGAVREISPRLSLESDSRMP